MNLSHYSDARTITPRSINQGEAWPVQRSKPSGLWVSVDGEDDWASWCREEDYPLGQYQHRVVLTDDARPLVLSTAQQVMDFHEQYLSDEFPELRGWHVNWAKLAEQYPGIIIAPYQWTLRISDAKWYYGWDCASGCIWDVSIIDKIERVKP